jgi:hypothetical protein
MGLWGNESEQLSCELLALESRCEDLERRIMIILAGRYRMAHRDHPEWITIDRKYITHALEGLNMDALWKKHDGCYRDVPTNEKPPEPGA